MKNYILVLLFALSISACGKGDEFSPDIKPSQTSIEVDDGINTEIITVQANTNQWQVKSNQAWCTVDKDNDNNLRIKTTSNTNKTNRTATVSFLFNNGVCQTVEVVQLGTNNIVIREIPVIYTILQTPDEKGQYLPAGTIEKNFNVLQRFFRNQYAPSSSVDVRVNFKLATTDPQGNRLTTPGLRYFEIPTAIGNYNTLLDNTLSKFPSGIQWDANTYVNIFIYDDNISGLLGVSVLPYTPENNSLPGLIASDYYLHKPLDKFRFVVIDLPHFVNEPESTTIAHEMGHYLGVLHPFSEAGCSETDYCNDTYNYNRSRYNWAKEGYSRTSCEGLLFESHNVMDYDITYSDSFTHNQNERMQHVLKHSPLIPGKAKTAQFTTVDYTGKQPETQAIQ